MASDSSPADFNNGPSSPDDSLSSPIGNTFSSPADATHRRRRRSITPSEFDTPRAQRSRFAASETTPTGTRRANGHSAAPAPTPSSTDGDVPPSSEGGDGYGMDEDRPTFVWGTNISVNDVKVAIVRFLKNFRDESQWNTESEYLTEGKYIEAIKRVIEMEDDSLDVDARNVFDYDSDLYAKMVRYPLEIVRLQETPDEIPEGGTPHTVSLLMHDKLVDAGKPGDRIEVTGIYRAMTVRVGPTQRTTYIDCLHIKKSDKSRMLAEDQVEVDNTLVGNSEEILFDEKKVEQLKELAKQPDIYDRLTRSLAPNIWELDDVKKGLLCQLFGGNALKLPSGARFRGDINILLVGDPGTSKSQLLQYIHKLAPRGIYTSGRGSSAVGLTAYVAKDPETGETVLESGALVLSDRGICCIDEFDKMSDSARSMLHEVMEQQTVSIAKAGIIASLNARTSVLACANPSGSRYNPRLSVIDNIHLPPTLLSRFDLIYLLLDKADEHTDRRLAKHIVALHFENPESVQQNVLDIATLTAYVGYARKHIHPQLSDEAAEELTRGYVELRRRGNFPGSSKKVITATPRQIESLIRLSEALARIRFSESVEKHDVIEAFRLLEVAMQQSATDHSTGTIDMDLITTGISASERMRRESLVSSARNIIMEKMQLGGPSMRLLELRTAITTLASEGFVAFVHGDSVKRI
ncbi:hypothetical protein C1H46_014978 [Malus baccata]|uniref:DNA replication licensing factor MCM4 n=1 Tax=Malus baccata TaxID=106549 RepID=A0A540MKU8_MALBA|nr:hypothetical protein C1H46_014978 [Malus baccata]